MMEDVLKKCTARVKKGKGCSQKRENGLNTLTFCFPLLATLHTWMGAEV